MKVVVAPDSFKGNLSAAEVCEALAQGFHDVDPSIEVARIPLADGGEGTARAITTAAGGVFRTVRVAGPLGDPVDAEFGLVRGGKTAVLDMASASGIELVPTERLDPLAASTYGTGELIRAALDAGVEELVLGIGGSATVDGGVGMATALGFEFLDADGRPAPLGGAGLTRIAEVRTGRADPRLRAVKVLVACDVTNPLLGERGAVRVFGPQKGATAETMPILEAGLAALADAWRRAGLASDVDRSGDGAAGGLGAALRVLLGAEMRSGALTVMEYALFREAARDADLVVTGEGMTDFQTAGGKLCSVVARECRALGVPVALLSGGLGGDPLPLLSTYDYAASISCGQVGLAEMIRDSRRDLRFAAANLARAFALGTASGK
jgi:glycerate kinase